jgi:hypothetical protein
MPCSDHSFSFYPDSRHSPSFEDQKDHNHDTSRNFAKKDRWGDFNDIACDREVPQQGWGKYRAEISIINAD